MRIYLLISLFVTLWPLPPTHLLAVKESGPGRRWNRIRVPFFVSFTLLSHTSLHSVIFVLSLPGWRWQRGLKQLICVSWPFFSLLTSLRCFISAWHGCLQRGAAEKGEYTLSSFLFHNSGSQWHEASTAVHSKGGLEELSIKGSEKNMMIKLTAELVDWHQLGLSVYS